MRELEGKHRGRKSVRKKTLRMGKGKRVFKRTVKNKEKNHQESV